MIEIGAVASNNTNLVTGTLPTGKAGDDDTMSMSFDDFLDMINPLEHIPVVSSIYRAVTGDTINPVSRIAGDALYGGVFGLASAGLSALGAIGDEAFASANGGQSLSATMVAGLFGKDNPDASPDTQLAAAAPPASDVALSPQPTMQLASSLQTPARQSPIIDMPDLSTPAATPATQIASAITPSNAPPPPAPALVPGLPLDRSKQPYGGAMDTAMLQNAQQNQTLALALASGKNNLQTQNAIRNGRFATATAPTATASAPAASDAQAEPQTQAAMQNLLQELQAMKSVDKYRNAAQSLPLPGTSVFNVTN